MATVANIACSPNPIPKGSTGQVTVTFTTDPGTPDVTDTVTIKKDGVTQKQLAVTIKGIPPEATPSLSLGSTGVGWEISDSAGLLKSTTTPNAFSILN